MSEYDELIQAQEEQINELKNMLKARNQFVYVRPPVDVDDIDYYRILSDMCKNEVLVFYFSKLQYEIMARFGMEKDNSEFYRGQMALITRIMKDSAIAADNYEAMK